MYNADVSSYMKVTHEFSGVRVLDNKLTPVKWTLNVNIAGYEHTTGDADDYKKHLTVAFQKVHLWLENFLADVYLVCINDTESITAFCEVGYDNAFVQLPHSATDDVFVEAITEKIRTLAGDKLVVGECTLRGDDITTAYCYQNMDGNSSILPEQKDWVTSEEVVYDTPWWTRDDCDTWEPAMVKGTSREDMLADVSTKSILETIVHDLEVVLGLKEDKSTNAEPEDSEADIVTIGNDKWTPEIV